VAWPRISYIPLLLSRLHAFFSPWLIDDPETIAPDSGYLTHDGVPLKWHLPLGLLYDLYVLSVQDSTADQPAVSPVPFRLMLHYKPDSINANVNLIDPDPVRMHDFFINAVKEADFLRSGTAKPIMSLSAADSKALWSSTQDNDLAVFAKIHQSLLPSRGQLRSVPLRIYLPSSPEGDETTAQMKVLQAQVAPSLPAQTGGTAAQARTAGAAQPQTLGTALHNLIPSLFPSRRTPILARPLLHGAPIPLSANLEELASWACYADGWIHLVIAMNS
jgi:autophagy-related protein 5